MIPTATDNRGQQYASVDASIQEKWLMLCVMPSEFDRAAAEVVWNVGPEAAQDALDEMVRHGLLEANRVWQIFSMRDADRQPAAEQMSEKRWCDLETNMLQSMKDSDYLRQRAIVAAQCLPNIESLGGTSARLRPAVTDVLRDMADKKTLPGDLTADKMVAFLDIAGRHAGTPDARTFLLERIDAFLIAQVPKRQRAQLLIYHAALLGQLERMEDAGTAYKEAARLIEELREAGDCRREDDRLLARIYLGLANIVEDNSAKEKDRKKQSQGLQEAVDLLVKARDAAEASAQDFMLQIGIRATLSYSYARLGWWDEAVKSYQQALDALNQTEDPHAYVSMYAQTLETGSMIHWRHAKSAKRENKVEQAWAEYMEAYHLAEKEADIGKQSGEEPEAWANGEFNMGDYMWAIGELPNCPEPNAWSLACDHWRKARQIAQENKLKNLRRRAEKRLQKHCP